MEFSTSKYEASHGRKPRGRGGWWFQVFYYSPSTGLFAETFQAPYGTLTEAKRWVELESRRLDVRRCAEAKVLP